MKRRTATTSASPIPLAWIRSLARPYLRGYRAVAERRGSLRGYWFLHPGFARTAPARRGSGTALGFFVGYLVAAEDFAFLAPEPPECLAFVYLRPLGGSLHRRLVRRPQSLLRRTFDYIRWLTHRPPRFVFYSDQLPVMVRHFSMRGWPRAKYRHFSRNFFIETLAWLVRSGLVERLLAEGSRNRGKDAARRVKDWRPPAKRSLSGKSSSR